MVQMSDKASRRCSPPFAFFNLFSKLLNYFVMHEIVGREEEWPPGDPMVDLSYEREGAGKMRRR